MSPGDIPSAFYRTLPPLGVRQKSLNTCANPCFVTRAIVLRRAVHAGVTFAKMDTSDPALAGVAAELGVTVLPVFR